MQLAPATSSHGRRDGACARAGIDRRLSRVARIAQITAITRPASAKTAAKGSMIASALQGQPVKRRWAHFVYFERTPRAAGRPRLARLTPKPHVFAVHWMSAPAGSVQ